ncbi:hypothetical protein QJS04_geneDACA011294 [Acorus gramineus]|uniref:Uncharacterized protein n=1 Tax=Acorus gramineus TaxID=55184 RepID=A0AAV9AKP1_ACOGR|nr:hypothetical protein QJS04_geneDACA011294 [Acorus gramineus]
MVEPAPVPNYNLPLKHLRYELNHSMTIHTNPQIFHHPDHLPLPQPDQTERHREPLAMRAQRHLLLLLLHIKKRLPRLRNVPRPPQPLCHLPQHRIYLPTPFVRPLPHPELVHRPVDLDRAAPLQFPHSHPPHHPPHPRHPLPPVRIRNKRTDKRYIV